MNYILLHWCVSQVQSSHTHSNSINNTRILQYFFLFSFKSRLLLLQGLCTCYILQYVFPSDLCLAGFCHSGLSSEAILGHLLFVYLLSTPLKILRLKRTRKTSYTPSTYNHSWRTVPIHLFAGWKNEIFVTVVSFHSYTDYQIKNPTVQPQIMFIF